MCVARYCTVPVQYRTVQYAWSVEPSLFGRTDSTLCVMQALVIFRNEGLSLASFVLLKEPFLNWRAADQNRERGRKEV